MLQFSPDISLPSNAAPGDLIRINPIIYFLSFYQNQEGRRDLGKGEAKIRPKSDKRKRESWGKVKNTFKNVEKTPGREY